MKSLKPKGIKKLSTELRAIGLAVPSTREGIYILVNLLKKWRVMDVLEVTLYNRLVRRLERYSLTLRQVKDDCC